jgi:hypothetical protein
MSHKFQISDKTADLLLFAKEALADEMQDHRDAFDEASDRWKEGDKGVAVDGWIDELQNLVDGLDTYENEPDF